MDFNATLAAALVTAMNNYIAALASPQPNYSIEGQSVTYSEYLKMLTDQINSIRNMQAVFDPAILITQGY